jgi:ABC-type branched-subunit amino acid transport system ATPase component
MLRVIDLDAFYGESHILHGVTLHVPPGGRVALLGRNGAGKSTVLKSIMNAGPRAQGTIAFADAELGGSPSFRRARLGMCLVPEDRRIFTHMTVLENIRFAARGVGALGQTPEAVLAQFPILADLGQRYGGQLSGGQQQMLAVARAVAASPRLLMLDEPTEGLAPVIVEQMAASVRALADRGQFALLLCEQNLWFARQCTDQLYIIDSGSIVFAGDWDSFDRDGEIAQKYLAV